jgi:phosphoglycerate dehydrogenase-like enzyme
LRAVAHRARSFGLEVCAFDRYVTAERIEADDVRPLASLEELLGASDFVSVHVPLTDETRGLLGRDAIAAMRPGAVLLNTSRGPIVCFHAVADALRSGRLAAVGLDVFESEPPDRAALESAPNLVATPHAAFYSEEAIRESQTKATEAILAVLDGREPTYRVA